MTDLCEYDTTNLLNEVSTMSKKLTEEQKAENKRIATEKREAAKKEREAQKLIEKIEKFKNQPRVTRIAIMIEWSDSRTWGSIPHLLAKVWGVDGFIGIMETTCSGCGYDKESTVIADVFNAYLKYKLFIVNDKKENKPYGVHLIGGYTEIPYYDGGIGTECYYDIAEFIGGTFKCTASGKRSTAYEYVDNGTIK